MRKNKIQIKRIHSLKYKIIDFLQYDQQRKSDKAYELTEAVKNETKEKHLNFLTSDLSNNQSKAIVEYSPKQEAFSIQLVRFVRQKKKKKRKMVTDNVLRFPQQPKGQSRIGEAISYFTTGRGIRFSQKIMCFASAGVGMAFCVFESTFLHRYIDVIRAYR